MNISTSTVLQTYWLLLGLICSALPSSCYCMAGKKKKKRQEKKLINWTLCKLLFLCIEKTKFSYLCDTLCHGTAVPSSYIDLLEQMISSKIVFCIWWVFYVIREPFVYSRADFYHQLHCKFWSASWSSGSKKCDYKGKDFNLHIQNRYFSDNNFCLPLSAKSTDK